MHFYCKVTLALNTFCTLYFLVHGKGVFSRCGIAAFIERPSPAIEILLMYFFHKEIQ